MKVLHLVKTTDGAIWAASQALELSRLGVDIAVALPKRDGRMAEVWKNAATEIFELNVEFSVSKPRRSFQGLLGLRNIINLTRPDIVHSHFVSTTLLARAALIDHPSLPLIFQVPGPLHLEHRLYAQADLKTARRQDFWIGSSRYIANLYRRYGIASKRLFVSYYGFPISDTPARSFKQRRQLGIRDDEITVGNGNYMYPPKLYLGQTAGLKRHEDVIDALGIATQKDHRIVGMLLGGAWDQHRWYEDSLRRRAQKKAGHRIKMTGFLEHHKYIDALLDLDLVVHVPVSENCGGAAEPLFCGIPVIASSVGGLPEFVIDSLTGRLVPPGQPQKLAEVILETVRDLKKAKQQAQLGQYLVRSMFDVKRTAAEVRAIYDYLLGGGSKPEDYDSYAFLIKSKKIPPKTT